MTEEQRVDEGQETLDARVASTTSAGPTPTTSTEPASADGLVPAASTEPAPATQDKPTTAAAVPTSTAPVRLAVFDYDGTIVDGQSGSLFAQYLLSHRLISSRTMGRLLWWGIRYKLHLPYRQDEARELIFRDLCALSREDALRTMREFHEEVLVPRCRADAIEEVRRRHEEGCVTLLISATFEEIAADAAKRLGIDGFVATRMQLDADGRFSGRVEGEVIAGEGKCRAVRRWADEHIGVGRWVIAYAYGDHFTDEPLLEQAEHCYAVCPGKTLRSMARRRGWPVLDWK